MPPLRQLAFTCLSSVLVVANLQAAVVDFETTPGGGTPTDNEILSSPYNISGGGTVRFFFDKNGNDEYDAGVDGLPAFEQIGNDSVNGFLNASLNQFDAASAGYVAQLGNFFIRNENFPLFPLIVDYNTPQIITALSGEIWDIDADNTGNEQWRIDALDGSNATVASQNSPVGVDGFNPLDGRPWVFGFSGLPTGFDKLRISFIGTKPGGVGLAFNNFDPTFNAAIPEAGSITLMAGASAAFAGVVVRRRTRA
jgi:hypothetical protein